MNTTPFGATLADSSAQLVYAIGRIGYDFGTTTREQSLVSTLARVSRVGTRLTPTKSDDLLRHIFGFQELELEATGGRVLNVTREGATNRVRITIDVPLLTAEDDMRAIHLSGVMQSDGTTDGAINGVQRIRQDPANPNQFILRGFTYTTDYVAGTGEYLLPRKVVSTTNYDAHPSDAKSVMWTLLQDSSPAYIIRPQGSFSEEAYLRLAEILLQQLGLRREGLDYRFFRLGGSVVEWREWWDPSFNDPATSLNYKNLMATPSPLTRLSDSADLVAVAGVRYDRGILSTNVEMDVIDPDLRGVTTWSQAELLSAYGSKPVADLFRRLLEETRNRGWQDSERAFNYAAAQLVDFVANNASDLNETPALERLEAAVRSDLCQGDHECFDVEALFFNPSDLNVANTIVRHTVDVGDVVPALVEKPRSFRRRSPG